MGKRLSKTKARPDLGDLQASGFLTLTLLGRKPFLLYQLRLWLIYVTSGVVVTRPAIVFEQ